MEAEKTLMSKISDVLIPYHKCTYVSKLSKEEILSKIARKTEPEKFFRLTGWLASNNNPKAYEGEVGSDAFKISKIGKRKNSNSPVILGEVSSSIQNTKVKLQFRLSYFVLIITPIWILFVGSTYLTGDGSFMDFDVANIGSWFPLMLLVLIYVVLTASFHYQVNKIKKELENMIEPADDADSGSSWIIRN